MSQPHYGVGNGAPTSFFGFLAGLKCLLVKQIHVPVDHNFETAFDEVTIRPGAFAQSCYAVGFCFDLTQRAALPWFAWFKFALRQAPFPLISFPPHEYDLAASR
jgi:hypothetical protein